MADMVGLEVGQRWMYRVGDSDVPLEVEVLDVREGKPARVQVSSVDGSVVGEWVPLGRLKVLWADRDPFLETEANWRALVSEPPEIEFDAAEMLFQEFLRPAATLNYAKARRGTVTILDFDLADVFVGGGLDRMVQGKPQLEDDEGIHLPWDVALLMAQGLSRAKTSRVMALVHAEESEGRALASGAQRGATRPGWDEGLAREISYFEKTTRPTCDLIRTWCGVGAAKLVDELREIREQAARLVDVVLEMSVSLARAGNPSEAWCFIQGAGLGVSKEEWEARIGARVK